eukprot:5246726-Pleurochrysis_carterae.AAC.1
MVNDNMDANEDDEMPPSMPFEDTTEQIDTNNEGTIAERLLRRRRQTAAVVASDLLITPTQPF